MLLVAGCGKESRPGPNLAPPSYVERPAPGPTRATDRAFNASGDVLIVEYHRVRKEEARWDRSFSRFRGDLKRLYDMGFRPATVRDMLGGFIDLAPGASPVVFTFDDSDPSQLRFRDDGSLDPECAVGIWDAFAKEHPDFPVRASFYVLPPTPWGQSKWVRAKLDWLAGRGCEIGSHTLTHRSLAKLSDGEVAAELGGAQAFLHKLGVGAVDSIALPLGVSPKRRALLQGVSWQGETITHKAVLLVGAGPAPSPMSAQFDPFRLPRIQAIEGPYGLTYWLDRVTLGKVTPFVAQGSGFRVR